jgi:hypothetical protein
LTHGKKWNERFPGKPGLPDGIFSHQKYKFWDILEGLGMKNVGVFYGNLEYFTAIWNIMWSLIYYVCGNLVCFVVIWYISPILVYCTRKIWQPWAQHRKIAPIRRNFAISGRTVATLGILCKGLSAYSFLIFMFLKV